MAHKQYIRHTEGNTAVLFIHGFLGSPEHFERFLPYVHGDTAVYNILLAGHGGSVRAFGKASMSQWKNQVDTAVGELLQRYESIIIVAHSMGTFFAYEAAVKHPDRIKCLFLLATPLKIGVRATAFVNTFKSFFGIMSEADAVGKAYSNAHSIKLTKRVWEYIGWIPRYLELFSESVKMRETIKNITVPVCVYQSQNDELVSMKSVRYIPQSDNIKLKILKNSAHFIYSEADEAFLIDEFKKLM